MKNRVLSRRRMLTFLLLFMAACGATSQGGPADTELRVMTFNIRYGTAPDGENVWSARRPLAIRVIEEFDPGVLGVQEALRFQLDEIRQALPEYGEIGVGRDDGRTAGEYSAILFDRARFEVLEQGTFWLSDTPEQPGSRTWGNRFARVATWGRLRDRESGRAFYVFNTHWDHESQPARERSAALILDRIAARRFAGEPVILMGDFNAGEDNPAFRALLAGGPSGVRLQDSFRAVRADTAEVGTFHAFKGTRTGARIDAILVSSHFRVAAAEIVRTAAGAVYPSDHYPVTTVLRY